MAFFSDFIDTPSFFIMKCSKRSNRRVAPQVAAEKTLAQPLALPRAAAVLARAEAGSVAAVVQVAAGNHPGLWIEKRKQNKWKKQRKKVHQVIKIRMTSKMRRKKKRIANQNRPHVLQTENGR